MQQAEIRRAINKLRRFGLGDTEALLYMKSLRLGPATVQELARALKMNRVTVHSAVDRLLERGLMAESRKEKRRLLVAADPKELFGLVEQRRLEVEQMSKGLQTLVNNLTKEQTSSRYFPTVRFYEGTKGFFKMTEETLDAKNDLLVFNYIPKFEQVMSPEGLVSYLTRKGKRGVHSKLLFPMSPLTKKMHEKRHIYDNETRLVPEQYEWDAVLFMWDQSVALGSYTEGHLTTTIIENKDIADMLRLMHKLIWDQAERMK